MTGDNCKVIITCRGGGSGGGVKPKTVTCATVGHWPTSSRPRCWSCWDFTTPVKRRSYYDR